MSAVSDVQTHLQYMGLVDITMSDAPDDWPSVRRRAHDESHRLVVLTEDGGVPPETPADAGIGSSALASPRVQVRVRAEPWNGDASEQKATEIIRELHGRQAITMGETLYMLVTALTDEPVFMGYDDNGRPEHTVSFDLTRAVPAPAN
jgi:hypothetical protein